MTASDLANQTAPHLAVIIPHYNDPVRLGTCLAALEPQRAALAQDSGTAPPPVVDIVVVDNGSHVDLGPLRATHPDIRFVVEPRKGAAAARNRGVAETGAPFIAFLDSDCVPDPDWLAVALRRAGRDDIAGGAIDTFDETPPPRSGAEAFETVFAFQQRSYIHDMGFSVTANLLTSRAVFADVGDMIVGLSEDKDWCLRARAKGYGLVYAEDLRVRHPTRSDWPALVRKWRRITDEMFALHGTTPRARITWALRGLAVLASSLPHLPRLLRSSRLHGAGERWRGAATLVGLRALRAGWMLRQALTGH